MNDFIDVEDVATATGLTSRQIRNDIRAGLFPGIIRQSKTIITRHQYEAWLRGEWQPALKRDPVQLLHTVSSRKTA